MWENGRTGSDVHEDTIHSPCSQPNFFKYEIFQSRQFHSSITTPCTIVFIRAPVHFVTKYIQVCWHLIIQLAYCILAKEYRYGAKKLLLKWSDYFIAVYVVLLNISKACYNKLNTARRLESGQKVTGLLIMLIHKFRGRKIHNLRQTG